VKLLIPISSFFGTPKSELWQLDTETKEQRLLSTLPSYGQEVVGKGFTSLAWVNNRQLVGCDFNRIFILDRALCELVNIRQDEQYNDLHHVSVKGGNIYLANTGRDCIEILDQQLRPIERLDFLSDIEVSARIKGHYSTEGDYYDNETSTVDFYCRKVPDKLHLNHVIKSVAELDNKIIATCFKKKCLIDAISQQPISNELPNQPHDGFIHDKFIWITTVSGQIYRSVLSLPMRFELFYDLFLNSRYEGWCRGLLVTEHDLYVGITAIHKESRRTSWLKGSIENTRTGVYRIDLRTLSIESFYDFNDLCGNRIFSIISDH